MSTPVRFPVQPCAEIDMDMRCVERTPEYLDSLVLLALLHSRQIDAKLFDENIARQNWFEILAYGGFRIMVPSPDLPLARETLVEYRSGILQRTDEETGLSTCPACHAQSGEFDHRQRRWVFLGCFVNGLVLIALAIFREEPLVPYLVFSCVFWLLLMMPWLLRYVINNRLRCSRCRHAWRESPRTPFAQQQLDVESALTRQAP
jgi:hypothetical protein